jgi:hypothetical protein
MALHVGDRLLGDAPQLALLHQSQAGGLVGPQSHLQAAAARHPGQEGLDGVGHRAVLAHVGAQVVERVAHLADHAPHVGAQLLEGGHGGLVPGQLAVLGDPVQLEGQVGQRLADAVVQVAGDAGALLVGAHGAQAGEPAGVVDGQGRRLGEARRAAPRLGSRTCWAARARSPAGRWCCPVPAGRRRDRRWLAGRVLARPRPAGWTPLPPLGGGRPLAGVAGARRFRSGPVVGCPHGGARASGRRSRRAAG